jgi:hypothetical protein
VPGCPQRCGECRGMEQTSSMDQLLNAEFREAFNEFDKVGTE